MRFYQNRRPQANKEFVEYSFSGGLRLDVPGDFNSQVPELKYYEGNVWYQRHFTAAKDKGQRQFLYFAGVSYQAAVWLNGTEVGRHEGGFNPFQFDVSDLLVNGENDLVVMVNNNRRVDGIPAMNLDWWKPLAAISSGPPTTRKGLVSDKGQRKKAWWVVRKFYETR